MKTKFLGVIPVIPSSNLEKDLKWYEECLGFKTLFINEGYAGLIPESIHIHLQWHANTSQDPLLGGSVIKIFVENIQPLFQEMVARKTINETDLRANTPWNTNEFGLYDLNKNVIFFVETLS